MNNLILTEYQSACRAAHEQVQLLRDLYEHLSSRSSGNIAADINLERRLAELGDFLGILSRELERQDLLPSRPDPEKEEALEFITGLKERFTAEQHRAVKERLAAEEEALLRLGEKLLENGPGDSLRGCLAATRGAVERLSRAHGPDDRASG